MNGLYALLREARTQPFVEGPLDDIPYARHLQLRFQAFHGTIVLMMPWSPALVGNPMPARLHGGVIAGLLDAAAWVAVGEALDRDGRTMATGPKPINVTVEYLREGKSRDSFASARITRLGRRVANVTAEAWQDDRTRPIATAHLNFIVATD